MKQRLSVGFTIVEVSVAIAVATVILVGLMTYFGVLFVNSTGTIESTKNAKQIQDTVSSLQ